MEKRMTRKALMYLLVLAVLVAGFMGTLTGCKKAEAPAEEADGGTVTALQKLSVQNGNLTYTYTYDYDFDKQLCTITGKNIPAGDAAVFEGLTFLFTPGILAGETLEAIPDVSGTPEELTLWAQPLVATDKVTTYKLVVYENGDESPAQTTTYHLKKNDSGFVTTCTVTREFREGDDVDYTIYYKYSTDGYLKRVKETSEDRDLVWEFNRNAAGKLTGSSMTVTDKTDDAIDSSVSTTTYHYDSDGVLQSTTTKYDSVSDEDFGYTTTYWFSETTNCMSALADNYISLEFSYGDDLQKLTSIEVKDTEGSSDYYNYTYAEFAY